MVPTISDSLRAVRDTNRFTDVEKEKAAWKRPSRARGLKEVNGLEATLTRVPRFWEIRLSLFFEHFSKRRRVQWSRQVRDQSGRFDLVDGLVHGFRPLRVLALLTFSFSNSRASAHIFPAPIAAS
jgi:hypothetical protein